jgi:hypothetical protein
VSQIRQLADRYNRTAVDDYLRAARHLARGHGWDIEVLCAHDERWYRCPACNRR